MDAIKKIFDSLNCFMQKNTLSSSHQYVLVGAIAFIGFPLFYWLWNSGYPQFHEFESFPLRLTGSVMGLILMSTPLWPNSMKPFIAWYWFLTLLYAFSFLFFYFFLMNHAEDVASMSLLCSVFLLVLLVDFYNLILILTLGFGFALMGYYLTHPVLYFNQEHIEVGVLALFFIIAGSLVRYKTAVFHKQRMKGLSAAAGMIAHELRTPLLGMKSGTQALNVALPALFEGYELAKEHGLVSSPLRSARLKHLTKVTHRIISEINYSNTIIDMLLMKAGKDNTLQNCTLEPCSMADCLKEAIRRYPFRNDAAQNLVTWKGDFMFIGSKLLMQHVIFNLLKNSLHAIAVAQRGSITIWTESCGQNHYLHVKDTAIGMSRKQLAHLFEHFYTTKFMGTGIGLSFCKMVMQRFGGDIHCTAEEGAYTQFTLNFPVIGTEPISLEKG